MSHFLIQLLNKVISSAITTKLLHRKKTQAAPHDTKEMAENKAIIINIFFIAADPSRAHKILHDYMSSKAPFMGLAIFEKEEVEINGQHIIRYLWLSSHKRALTSRVLNRGSSGGIIIYYKDSRRSFELAKAHFYAHKKIVSSLPPLAFLGIAHESDTVTTEEGMNLAEELNATYYEMFEDEVNIFRKVLDDLSHSILELMQR